MGITSLVLVVVFAAIYISSTRMANNRPPMPNDRREEFSEDVENFVEKSIEEERQVASRELLIM